jgi:hypothetical protein
MLRLHERVICCVAALSGMSTGKCSAYDGWAEYFAVAPFVYDDLPAYIISTPKYLFFAFLKHKNENFLFHF